MVKIKSIKAWEVIDSRGNPTVEAKVVLKDGSVGLSSVPSGASVGRYEALELRDKDPNRFWGKGVSKAVNNINKVIAPQLVGRPARPQLEIDKALILLDGSKNKSKLGANAILAVSEAVCKAGAVHKKIPLFRHIGDLFGLKKSGLKMPTPVFNLINGGKHGAGNLDFQEFQIIPIGNQNYSEKLRQGVEVYHATKEVLIRHGAIYSVGDEGGFAPNLFTNTDALDVLQTAIKEAGYSLRTIRLGLDIAAGTFYKDGQYRIRDRTMPMGTTEMATFYRELCGNYPLESIEDPFHEDDWKGWSKITKELPKTIVIGDDLLATNKERVQEAAEKKACNATIIKPNQIGTVAETIEVIKIVRQAKWKVVVSHRSGETNDSFIADFAVGVGADYVKFGAPARGERIAKYNRLLMIERELKSKPSDAQGAALQEIKT